jgi:parvulin-like peptidyl-prolyl isomerase
VIVPTVCAAVALGPRWTGDTASEIATPVDADAVTPAERRRVQADLLELGRLQGQAGVEASNLHELESRAVRTLLDRQLMLEEAERRSLSVSDDELDQALTELRGRFADLESFGAWMQERGLDDRLLIETIRDDILVRRVAEALVAGARVSEEEIVEYYEAHSEELNIGEEVRLQIIVVDSKEAGEAIMTALSEGENFSRLARRRSLGSRASRGGDTGWVNRRTLPPPLRDAVGSLNKGEAYGPLEKRSDEFLIVALAGRRAVRAASLETAQPEVERRLLATKQRKAVEEWLTEQSEKAKMGAKQR